MSVLKLRLHTLHVHVSCKLACKVLFWLTVFVATLLRSDFMTFATTATTENGYRYISSVMKLSQQMGSDFTIISLNAAGGITLQWSAGEVCYLRSF